MDNAENRSEKSFQDSERGEETRRAELAKKSTKLLAAAERRKLKR